MACSLLTINNGDTIPGTFASGGCGSMGRGNSNNYAAYYTFNATSAIQRFKITLTASVPLYDTYIFLRSGNAANTVSGVNGFGSNPALSFANTIGNSTPCILDNYRYMANMTFGSPPILSPGDYTIECTTSNALVTGNYTLSLEFSSFGDFDGYTKFGAPNFTLANNFVSNVKNTTIATKMSGDINDRNRESGRITGIAPMLPYSVGGGGPTTTTYYKMRGYYVAGSIYETYVVTNAPSSTPPSGHTLTNVVIVSTWTI